MGDPAMSGELQVGLLGSLTVSRRGAVISIPSGPQRRLLSMLALHAGDVVRSSVLEDQAGLSSGALRTSISRLRRVVGTDALETATSGYRLRAAVDLVAFERMVGVAPELSDAQARTVLTDAVALWRGDPMAEFHGESWTEVPIRRLAEQFATALEDLALLQLDAGETTAAVATVGRVVEREPFRERPRALLIRALAEDGRPTEALRAFQSYRALLRDEIGIAPSAALVELDRSIASSVGNTVTAFGTIHPAWVRERRATPRTSEPRHHLPPVPVSSFVGRSNDVATVLGLVTVERLVTLTGAGGCGKTRLAIAVAGADAERRGRPARWVELGVVSTPSHVVEHVAAALGLTLRHHIDAVRQMADHVADAPSTLLVLDNAEHVIAPVAELLSELLQHCPSLRVLVTSRGALGIAGERVWRVPSLSTPPPGTPVDADVLMSYDAVRLFLDRARSARPDLASDRDALAHMASICTGVDGLPLAVELAAARTRTHPVAQVAAGINDAVRWQTDLHRAPLARHATLHASIQWSVDLVEPLARAVLIRLSVFETSFSFEAGVAVGRVGEPPDLVADAISTLVDAHLLQLDGSTDRLRMLRTVRRFCALRPDGGSDIDGARARHARYFTTYCQHVGEGRHGIERGPFIREMPDIVAAMEWAREHEPSLMFRICSGLASVRTALGSHGNIADTWRWLLSLDRGPTSGETWRREWATAVAAHMAAATAHSIDVNRVVDEIHSLLPGTAHRERGWAGRGAAMRPAYQGHVGPILAYADDVRARHDDLEYSVYGGFAAYMSAMMGRLEEAERHVVELERLSRRHTASFSVDTVGNGVAAAIVIDLIRGNLSKAASRADAPVPDDASFSMTAAAALAHVALVAGNRDTLARAVEWSRQPTIPLLRFLPTFIELVKRRFSGNLEHAADLAEQMWEEAEIVPVSRVHPLPVLTAALVDARRLTFAREMTERAASLVGGMDAAPLLSACVLASRALLDLDAGDIPTAAVSLRELLDISTTNGLVQMTIDALNHVANASGDGQVATTLRSMARPGATLVEAVRLGQRWLASVAPA